MNPPPTYQQQEDERKAQKAYERTPEGQAELRREKEERERREREQEERDRKEHPERFEDERAEPSPVIGLVVENVKVEPQAVKIDIVKNGTQSAAPEIISPNFTAKGAVNQTRFAEAMRDVKRRLRSAYALSNRATFFKHARDMLDELEREFTAELARSA